MQVSFFIFTSLLRLVFNDSTLNVKNHDDEKYLKY